MDLQRRDFLKLLAAASAAGLAPSAWAAGKDDFTVYGAPALPSMIIGIAALQGKLRSQANVSLKVWRSPDQLRAGVASGQYQVMMSPSNVGVNLRNQGQKVGMVNILTNGIVQLVGKQQLAHPQDLIGKKIIVPFKNDMPDIVLQAMLKKLNIDINKVSITYAATSAEAVGLFLAKDFHAAWLPEPMASACILRGKQVGVNVVRGFDVIKTWGQVFNTKPMIPQAGLIANVDFYQANKAKFDLFHQDLVSALNWAKGNVQSAAQIGKNYLPAPVPALVNGLPYANLTVTKASSVKTELLQFYEELMRFNPKLLGGKLPDNAFFLA